MTKRIIQLFASSRSAPDLEVPSIELNADARDGRYILTVSGLRYPRANSGRPIRFAIQMAHDDALGLKAWLHQVWTVATTTHFRSLFLLRSGKLIGIETFDGENFLFLGGEMPPHEWDIEWRVQGDASRDDLVGIVTVMSDDSLTETLSREVSHS